MKRNHNAEPQEFFSTQNTTAATHATKSQRIQKNISRRGKCSMCRKDGRLVAQNGGICFHCWTDVQFHHYFNWKSGKPHWAQVS